jgi:hypothetical protein
MLARPAGVGTLAWTRDTNGILRARDHLSNLRPPRHSAEAYVVYAGARLDVAGYRYSHLHPTTVGSLLERHPRLDMKRAAAPMFDAEAAGNRGSRVHFYTRYLAVKWFMRRPPFPE